MLGMPAMLVAVAFGALAAAWLQERADTRTRRRRIARTQDLDATAALLHTEDADAAPRAVADERLAAASADARVDAAVRRAAAAEAAAAAAEEAAAAYREAYLAACASSGADEDAIPLPEPRRTAAASASGGETGQRALACNDNDDDAAVASGDESDADWDRVSLALPRCSRCAAASRARSAYVPCGHVVCSACGAQASACHVCGALVSLVLRLEED
jgi:hypothetical protein